MVCVEEGGGGKMTALNNSKAHWTRKHDKWRPKTFNMDFDRCLSWLFSQDNTEVTNGHRRPNLATTHFFSVNISLSWNYIGAAIVKCLITRQEVKRK